MAQRSTATLVSSVPLSLTMTLGVPRSSVSWSSSRTTRTPPSEVSTTRVRHSRLKSSTTPRMRKRRPSLSVSETKSSDQRWLIASGRIIGARVPIARLRPPLLRQLAQALTQCRIVCAPGLIAPYRMIDPDQPACPPLTQPVLLDQPVHREAPCRRPHTFFPSRSLSAALSSIASASSFLSRRFSSSSDFNRRASDTSNPPYFAFHL